MAAHHRRMRNIDRRAIRLVRDAARQHPWSRGESERRDVATDLVEGLSNVYGVPVPRLVWDDYADMVGGGYYRPGAHAIGLSRRRFSLLTLVHEFRHALQACGATMVSDDREDDARAWSLSLYARACPRRFRRMVRAGRVLYVSPEDLG